jgi:hypothetical protein
MHDAPTALSANLKQLWLTQFDRDELNDEEAEASVIAEYEAHIGSLERNGGQLTMELDLVKKHHANRSPATTRNPSSSPARGLFRSAGMRNDRSPEKHLLLPRNDRAENLGDAELVALIEDIQDEIPCYGYRRVTHELHRRGHLVNHKRVARVMRASGLGIGAFLCLTESDGLCKADLIWFILSAEGGRQICRKPFPLIFAPVCLLLLALVHPIDRLPSVSA